MITILSVILYFGLIITVGIIFSRRNNSLNEYIIGGRSNNKWVTAISAQASDMSSWLLMGLPGALYLSGLGASSGSRLNVRLTEASTAPMAFAEAAKAPARTKIHIISMIFLSDAPRENRPIRCSYL